MRSPLNCWHRGSVASTGTPPPGPARGGSGSMGFRRADVGGSKRLPAPYKAVWTARASDRAGPGGELGHAGSLRAQEPQKAESSLSPLQSPRGTRAGRRPPGSRACFSRHFVKRAPSPPPQLRERWGPLGAALSALPRAGAAKNSARAWRASAPEGEQRRRAAGGCSAGTG